LSHDALRTSLQFNIATKH